jgi:ATP-dependent helicase/nuclease subunit A
MSAQPDLSAEDIARAATDPTSSAWVSANAGAGKTHLLTDRVTRLLLAGSDPARILCLTYTKAAAAEMTARLFHRLGAWALMSDPDLSASLAGIGAGVADATRLRQARTLFAKALETPGGLKIQTIHAFCERLLARFPLEAGVPPGFEIADDARAAALLSRARADAVLAADAPVNAFRRFAARLSADGLEALMDRLAQRRAHFHRFCETHQGPIFADAALRNRHNARESAEAFASRALAGVDWNGLRQAAAALLGSSANNQKTGQRITAAIDAHNQGAPARAVLEHMVRIAVKGDGEAYEALVTASFAKQEPWLTRVLDPVAVLAASARAQLNAIDRAEDAAAVLALALKLDQAYGDAKAAAGVLDFDDLIEHARRLLGQSEAAPWVLYKLDGGLDHILIDEGQDTSPAQWELIAPLQEEFFAGRGARERARTLFAVGDPKQSIYSFQGADPGRFLEEARALEKRARRAKLPFAAPDLLTSFRSAPEILAVVDATLKNLPLLASSPQADDVIEHLAARENQCGVVEVWPLALRPPVQPAQAWDAPMDVESGASAAAMLAREIARRVSAMIAAREAVWEKGALRALRAGDVLALVRTRGAMFRELIKAFKRAGLPVAGADRMVLREELAVEDCLALMRMALDPADDLSLACVLKGPWLGLDDDDADIFPLAYGRGKHETLLARLLGNSEAKYAPARAFVAELIARKGADAFAFLSWALETPHAGGASGWALLLSRLGPEARDPVEELLQRALKPGAHASATLQRFLHEIDADSGQVKREMEADSGAVRVMTVHGAKGLEAPLVILPDTTGDVEDAPDNGLIFDDATGPVVSFRGRDDDAAVAAARAGHQARMLSEHWRLLYVAMTRARDRLIVCGAQWRDSEARPSWRLAVENGLRGLGASACETPFGEGLRWGAPLFAQAGVASAPVVTQLPAWALAPAPGGRSPARQAPSLAHQPDPALFSPRGDGQKRFRRGRLIHGLLERLPEIAPERRAEAARAWLGRRGASEEEAARHVQEALTVMARFPALFGPLSRAEAPIVGMAAGRAIEGIVDRLTVEETQVTVLDYKTDRPAPAAAAAAPPAYVLQMSLYREVLQQIFPGRNVVCALLWTEAPLLMWLAPAQLEAAFLAYQRG